MKNFFREMARDKTVILAYSINGFLIITAVIFVLISYGNLPPLIPIFNQLPWGEQRLGATITIFIPILAALLILIINIVISAMIYKKILLVARMLAAISLLIGILTFLLMIKTITLIL
ncbi:MAG: hypothetical protein A3H79_03450 [Candidatus Levybacteria bacterium RIFCSPLOWO2_02_FULL_36_8b]|nr:MAG: hypothetical protein A3H79_03450 [Candidatus Levybacteria bacterium RIFCSPLOWO2_02_FULL_36_8b]